MNVAFAIKSVCSIFSFRIRLDFPVLQASTGHCAVYAEESVYRQIDTLLAQEKKGPRV